MPRLSYDCPYKLRGNAIQKSDILDEGKMVCLIAIHEKTRDVNVVLLEVHLRETTVSC